MYFKVGKKNFNLASSPLILGILNLTPDSFYDGNKYKTKDSILKRVDQIIKEGADILDIGGESTRPKSKRISVKTEKERILNNIILIKKNFDILISVDTMKSQIADICLNEGADIINDVTSYQFDEKMPYIIAKHKGAVILNHTSDLPNKMQLKTNYKNLIYDIKKHLSNKAKLSAKLGINIKSIAIDPGIGFGKTTIQNLKLIKNAKEFKKLKYPLMYGVSNKAFLGEILNIKNPKDRLNASVIAGYACISNGANLLRVHNIKETKEMIKIWRNLKDVRD
ncbi:dihydropteroate synthase [bacterium]|jgi:dihydropteroate synthase|nr:dihydropteroate synthase [bacterium]MBT3795584.1 dihydropteroate synthase [bacterium]MBT4634077.1 dihydropteroate synthase [bacterium]